MQKIRNQTCKYNVTTTKANNDDRKWTKYNSRKRYNLPGLSQLVRNLKFFRGLNQNLNFFLLENYNLSGMLNKEMQLERITNGGRSRRFLSFFEKKNSLFNAIWIIFYTFLEPFEKTKWLKFGSHTKELNCPAPPTLLTVKFKTGLNACI